MKIVADSNILFVEDAFKDFGELLLYKTRIEDRNILKNADALLCRSTMKINKELLDDSGVEFIATATSGTEHFDTEYLDSINVNYSDAKGSNSNSVAEYIVSALLRLSVMNELSLEGKSIGIVGWGCVGKKVEKMAEALGLEVFVNDPPLEDSGEKKSFVPLDDILKCDIITLHVPLNRNGKYKTENLFDSHKFEKMKKGSVFINACRGKVVDEAALADAKKSGRISSVVLDVWQNEPDINTDMFDITAIATPHIAGHSLDGKALGTQMVFDSFCNNFNLNKKWNYRDALPLPDIKTIEVMKTGKDSVDIYNAIHNVYNIDLDDSALRNMKTSSDKAKYFDSLRRNYRVRREFYNTKIICTNSNLCKIFSELGFIV